MMRKKWDGYLLSLKKHYASSTGEVVVEDGWREKFNQSGIKHKILSDWSREMFYENIPKISFEEAKENVLQLLQYDG
ncbi:MAG: hypothetical protein LBP53_03855 [Candidatus Peribacteria bacterium]|jgi:hypothetical protein|nr:hypothetical protein [Candidatus Peribacteria bacterium]